MANFVRRDVEGTPFSIYENTDNGRCKIVCGASLMTTKEFNSDVEAIKYIKKKPWELIINTIMMSYDMLNNMKEEKKGDQNND